MKSLNKQTVPIHKIYITCAFDEIVPKTDSTGRVYNALQVVNNRDFIMSELTKLASEDARIVLLERPNVGGTYHAWKEALHVDANESDYIFLSEDDYALYDENALKYIMEYWTQTPDLFYLCQYWKTTLFQSNGLSVPEHAAIACGMLNNKLYNEMREKHNIDFLLVSDVNIWMNQATFMENFRQHSAKFADFRDKYSCVFAHSLTSTEELGVDGATKLIMPIVDKFFS